jgi:hypothetical protein
LPALKGCGSRCSSGIGGGGSSAVGQPCSLRPWLVERGVGREYNVVEFLRLGALRHPADVAAGPAVDGPLGCLGSQLLDRIVEAEQLNQRHFRLVGRGGGEANDVRARTRGRHGGPDRRPQPFAGELEFHATAEKPLVPEL